MLKQLMHLNPPPCPFPEHKILHCMQLLSMMQGDDQTLLAPLIGICLPVSPIKSLNSTRIHLYPPNMKW